MEKFLKAMRRAFKNYHHKPILKDYSMERYEKWCLSWKRYIKNIIEISS